MEVNGGGDYSLDIVFLYHTKSVYKDAILRIINELTDKYRLKIWSNMVDDHLLPMTISTENTFSIMQRVLRKTRLIVCCMTKEYDESRVCQRELILAVNLHKPIIILMFCDTISLKYTNTVISNVDSMSCIKVFKDIDSFLTLNGSIYSKFIDMLNDIRKNNSTPSTTTTTMQIVKPKPKSIEKSTRTITTITSTTTSKGINNLKKENIFNISKSRNSNRDQKYPKPESPMLLSSQSVSEDSNYEAMVKTEVIGINNSIKSRFKSGVFKLIDINIKHPCDMCPLRNGDFLISQAHKGNMICLYDKNFNLVQAITKIDGGDFRPVSIVTGANNDLYISDSERHRIIRTDMLFHIKGIFGGIKGDESNQLDEPWGISFYNNSLYVCDTRNGRIQKLSAKLTFEKSFPLDHWPMRIKISNNVACVRGVQNFICFYELTTFKLLCKYDRSNDYALIGEISSFFYEYCDGTLYCYNSNGEINDQIKVGNYEGLLTVSSNQQLVYLNGKIILFSTKLKKKLLII